MKFLIDLCISKFAVEELRENNYDAVWIAEEGKDLGDAAILQLAYEQDRTLITADKDFGELVFVFQHPHPAIIRLVNIKAKDQGEKLLKIIEKYKNKFSLCPLITIDQFRVRIKYPGDKEK